MNEAKKKELLEIARKTAEEKIEERDRDAIEMLRRIGKLDEATDGKTEESRWQMLLDFLGAAKAEDKPAGKKEVKIARGVSLLTDASIRFTPAEMDQIAGCVRDILNKKTD